MTIPQFLYLVSWGCTFGLFPGIYSSEQSSYDHLSLLVYLCKRLVSNNWGGGFLGDRSNLVFDPLTTLKMLVKVTKGVHGARRVTFRSHCACSSTQPPLLQTHRPEALRHRWHSSDSTFPSILPAPPHPLDPTCHCWGSLEVLPEPSLFPSPSILSLGELIHHHPRL